MKKNQLTLKKLNRNSFLFIRIFAIFIFFNQVSIAQENNVDEKALVVGVNTERKVVGQEFHAYSIRLKRGQVLRIALQEKGADAMIYVARIVNSESVSVSAASNFGSGFMRESITAIADEDGLYGLGVRSVQSDENVDARYEFTATLTDSVTLSDKQRFDAEVTLFRAGGILNTNDKEKMPLAIAELEKQVKIWQDLGDKYWEARTKMIIASIAFKINELDTAETFLLQAVNLLDKVKNKAEIGNIYSGLGNIYIARKDEVKAAKYFNDALAIARSIGDKRTEKTFSGLNSQSLRSYANGNLNPDMSAKKASDFESRLNDAIKKNDEAAQVEIWNDYLFAIVLGNISVEDSNIAGTYPQNDPEREKPAERTRLVEVFEAVEKNGLRLAKKLKNRTAEMQMLVVLGLGYTDLEDDTPIENAGKKNQTEKFRKAKNFLIQGLALSKLQNDQLYETLAYAGLSMMYDDDEEKLGIFFGKKFVTSIHSYRKTFVNLASREDQQLIASYTEGFYGVFAAMLTELNRLDEALLVVNLARDQEFFDYKLLDRPVPKIALSVTEEANEKEFDKFLNDVITRYAGRSSADYFSAADAVKKEFDTLEENFDDDSDSANDIVRNVKDAEDMKAALDELSKKTGKNHVSIYHFKDDDDDNFLLVTRTDIKFFSDAYEKIPQEYSGDNDRIYIDFLELLSRKKFDVSANRYVDKVCAGGYNSLCDPKPLSSVIYKSIFKSFEFVKGEKETATLESTLDSYNANVIHWSLSGKLRYVPIAALYDEERKQYLVEQYENVIFTRAKKESFLLPPKTWTNGIGFGNANDLPAVRQELDAIFGNEETNQKALFGGSVFMNEKFNAGSLLTIRQTKPDFVHIASHFKFQPGEASQSVLQLGDGKLLSLAEMQTADRLFEDVDLLTLSACQTAVMYADANGKEIDGFAELAQRRGARSVIATLWNIDDPSAYKLMATFYRLKQENPDASKAEVLRLAQMSLLNGENSWDVGLRNRIAERERAVGNVGNKAKKMVETATNKYTEIPFAPVDKSPFAHPYYWAAFVLYGGSNGGKLTKTYAIPPSPPRVAVSDTEDDGSSSTGAIRARDFIGVWEGVFDVQQYFCILEIEKVEGNTFQGKLKPQGGVIEVVGTIDPATRQISFFESKVISLGGNREWLLGSNRGSFSNDGTSIKGTGSAGNFTYQWSFSKKGSGVGLIQNFSNQPVTLKDIETSYNNKFYGETIRLGEIFLQSTPDSPEANLYIGLAYLLRQDTANATNYLEKAIKRGQPLSISMKRLRIPLLGHAFEEARIILFADGLKIDTGDSIFEAKYSELNDARLNTYYANFSPQCGTVQLKGVFTEVKKKSEKIKQDKKQFDLFTMSAYLQPKLVGRMTVNEAACNSSEDFVPATIISLIARFK